MNWLNRFDTFCFLDNHQYHQQQDGPECIAGVGIRSHFTGDGSYSLPLFQQFLNEHKSQWLMGHLAYDFQVTPHSNQLSKPDKTGFPDCFFFEPEIILRFDEYKLEITATNAEQIFIEIMDFSDELLNPDVHVQLQSAFNEESYQRIIEKLLYHIHRGDCYEINFCLDFFAEHAKISPVEVFQSLSRLSPHPFAALYRLQEKWLICASPERYLKKTGNQVLSQPMKGTSKRIPGDTDKNEISRKYLLNSEKEKSENVMIVDLVRNDLSRICKRGSVKVDELFGVYEFPHVYQMVSTISGELKENISFTDMLQATYPMGSMTGAPKKRVMELIQQYEPEGRGLFSGTLGYFSPSGDFDFNVIIRSLMYNSETDFLRFPAGSGITFNSDPKKEWEECLMKVDFIRQVLGG